MAHVISSFMSHTIRSVICIGLQEKDSPQIARVAGDSGSEVWPFWVDLANASSLHIELSVSFWDRWAPEIDHFIADVMPDWTTLLAGTTYVSDWTFPGFIGSDA